MIEVGEGEYVRSPYQGIFIISHININFDDNNFNKVLMCQNEKVFFTNINTIKQLKHSKNLIDLIECGDYVNGKEILEVRQNTENGLRYLMYDYVPIKYYVERTDEIKSIVTHEQFEQIKYKVKEN